VLSRRTIAEGVGWSPKPLWDVIRPHGKGFGEFTGLPPSYSLPRNCNPDLEP